jgi:hypothetical protein
LALLNITKKQQDNSKPIDVPDELPDLPTEAPHVAATPEPASMVTVAPPPIVIQPPIQQQIVISPPQEIKPVQHQEIKPMQREPELAPDELSPVHVEKKTIEPKPSRSNESKLNVDISDRRLYFSDLLRQMKDQGTSKLTSANVNFLADMRKHWDDKLKEAEVDELNKEVEDRLMPLQRLEKEWVMLKEDIENKKKQLRKTEDEIRALSEELREMAVRTESFKAKRKK